MQGSGVQDKEFLNYSNCNEKGSTFLNSNIIIEKNTLSPKWIMDHREVKKKKDLIWGLVGIHSKNEYSLYYDVNSRYGKK